VTLVARLLDDLPVLLIVAMILVVIAQVSTNMAAYVVPPSNDFSNSRRATSRSAPSRSGCPR
jgi:nucleobase:cation symporter-1, NCS1 family